MNNEELKTVIDTVVGLMKDNNSLNLNDTLQHITNEKLKKEIRELKEGKK